MPSFTTKLGKTYFIKKGRRSNRYPLISCHGGPGGTHLGAKPILELANERQVVVFDQIGSGLSSAIPKSKWKIETFCQNLNELIKHLGYEKVVLQGGSWGGTLILEYYKRYPKKVAGLIFHSALIDEKTWAKDAKYLISKMPKKVKETILACEKVGATDSKVYKNAMRKYYMKHVCRDKSVWSKKRKPSRIKGNDELYEYMWGPSEFCATGTLKNYSGLATIKKIKVPSLFISGQYDEAMPRSAKKFAKMTPGGEFKEIKGASHSSLREKKKESLKAISDFCKKNGL